MLKLTCRVQPREQSTESTLPGRQFPDAKSPTTVRFPIAVRRGRETCSEAVRDPSSTAVLTTPP